MRKFFLSAIIIFLFVFSTSSYAQVIQDDIVMINVDVADASVKQNEDVLNLQFTILNGNNVQPDIHYGIVLRSLSGLDVYHQVYEGKTNMDSNTTVKKTWDVSVPPYYLGDYELHLILQNGSGMPLADKNLGIVSFTHFDAQYIDIDETSCYLSVDGKKFTLQQGIDVSDKEEIHLICAAQNRFREKVVLGAMITTYSRSMYSGKEVSVGKKGQEMVFMPFETKNIDVVIPKAKSPQSYDAVFVLARDGKEVSDKIRLHYVVQGESASISNITLDKSAYKNGDEMNIMFIVGRSADQFEGSRSGKNMSDDIYYTLSIKNELGEDCVAPFAKKQITNDSDIVQEKLMTIRDCQKPTMNIVLQNVDDDVLTQNSYNFFSGDEKNNGKVEDNVTGWHDAMRIIVGGIGLIIFIVLMVIGRGIIHKRFFSVIFLIFLFGWGFLYASHDSYAVTLYSKILRVGCSFSLSDTKVNPGDVLTASAYDCVNNYCYNVSAAGYIGNEYVTSSAFNAEKQILTDEEHYKLTHVEGVDCTPDIVDFEYGTSYGTCSKSINAAIIDTEYDSMASCQDGLIEYVKKIARIPNKKVKTCKEYFEATRVLQDGDGYDYYPYGVDAECGDELDCCSKIVSTGGISYRGAINCAHPQKWTNYAEKEIVAPMTCGINKIPIKVMRIRGGGTLAAEGVLEYETVGCIDVPKMPESIDATCAWSGTRAHVTWPTVGDAAYYKVQYDKNSPSWNDDCNATNDGDVCKDQTGTSVKVMTDSGKSNTFSVKACNSKGCSEQKKIDIMCQEKKDPVMQHASDEDDTHEKNGGKVIELKP